MNNENDIFDDSAGSRHADAWPLDPAIAMLNHGSFGACPAIVLRRQAELRRQMEAEPVRFFLKEMQPLLDQSRRALAELLGGQPENLVFVTNATAAINSVLRSLEFGPGDELLVTAHGYNACNNVARYVAQAAGASLAVAQIPLPIASPQDVLDAILARATPRTRIALIDHITSPTAVVFPIEEIVARLAERGIDTLVDGAHGPGMVPVDLERIGAAYYAGNCHKWLCAPKGAGFLYARPDRQAGLQPPVISHGFNQSRPGYTRFQDAFDWPGTADPTAWLCVGEAIRFLSDGSAAVPAAPCGQDARTRADAAIVHGGLERLMRRNRDVVLAASRMICQKLGLRPACPEAMTGSMAAILLPDEFGAEAWSGPEATATTPVHRFYDELLEEFAIEVPVYYWQTAGQAILRISAQAYNSPAQYERLAEALVVLMARAWNV